MKKCTVFIMLLAMVLFFGGAAYADLNDGLVAYYPFNGNANDESINDHNGIESGDVSYIAGKFGQAATFDGANDYIEIQDDGSLSGFSELTVSCWFNANSLGRPQAQALITKSYQGDGKDETECFEFGISYEVSLNNFVVVGLFSGSGFSSENYIYSLQTVEMLPGQWYHAALTWDGSTVTSYFNGEQIGTDSFVKDILNINISQPLHIAKAGGTDPHVFDGKIDEVRIYDRALSEAEIQDLFYTNAAFSSFINEKTKVEYKLGRDDAIEAKMEIKWYFTLGEENDGIDLLAEDVEFTVGDINLTIPAGSFQFDGEYELTDPCNVFEDLYTLGTCDEKKTHGKIKEENEYYKLDVKIDKCELPEVGIVNPLHIELLIGDDKGEADLYLLGDHGKVEFKGKKP